MPLNNYILNGPATPTGGRTPAQSWQWHLDNNSGRGGVDLVADTNTPVLAPTDGVLVHVPNDGGAGNSCRFNHDDNPGWADVFSHLTSYVGVSGRHFNQGDVIAYSGATGGNYAPHLHRHLLKDGVRYNPWNYFGTSSGALSTFGAEMQIVKVQPNGLPLKYFVYGNGRWAEILEADWVAGKAAGLKYNAEEISSTDWAKVRAMVELLADPA